MKTIGLIGGLSWESSAQYYRLINQDVRRRLGGVRSAKSLMVSLEFGEIEALQHRGDWSSLAAHMVAAAQSLETGGADFVLICSNTMHEVADAVAGAVGLPFLHIVDPTGAKIAAAGHRRVGLLGTAFTMEREFYKRRLSERFGLEVIIPNEDDRIKVHDIIYEELVKGIISPLSRAIYRSIIARLVEQGAQAIILGCTEIMLLVDASDSPAPLFDTTALHAEAAVDLALSDQPTP